MGSHTIHVYARDEAGNWNEASVTYTIDNTAPTITHDGPADTIDLTNVTRRFSQSQIQTQSFKLFTTGIVMPIKP